MKIKQKSIDILLEVMKIGKTFFEVFFQLKARFCLSCFKFICRFKSFQIKLNNSGHVMLFCLNASQTIQNVTFFVYSFDEIFFLNLLS